MLLSAFTLLWRIDGTVLWRDEATTANWAREMIERRTLIPRVFHGERLMAQAPDGHDFDDRFLPAMQGWLQFYVAAAGFLLGGVGTVSARLPFVLAGAVSLWLLYRIGREALEDSRGALAAPLLAALSIYFLTAARQARYYALVVLFTCAILLEFARYLRDPARARSPGFYCRLGLYGLLVYLANYVSFAGLWLSLAVFVLWNRDRVLLGRFALLTALLALPVAGEFWWVHAGFVSESPAAQRPSWETYRLAIDYHGTEMFRLIPLAALLPAGVYVFRRGNPGPVAGLARLCVSIVVVSVVGTVLAGPSVAINRYYFQIVPALLLLTGLLAERLRDLAGGAWAAVFFLFVLVWPNLNFYHAWCEHAVERQLTRDTTCNEPIVEFLRRNVGPGETVAFHRNVQGMMVYFNLPDLKWVALLDSNEPRNQRRRSLLPAHVFDDWEGVDWYVIWDNRGAMPRKLTADYQLVWDYSYVNPKSWWNRAVPNRVLGYRVYRRSSPGGGTRR